ncbi:hypothetical protein HY488_01465 [Candidatus Woesearchaeota archaeon]|nr:hypothetical protein [Candidatus Woesearchaeota archaeon]
MRFHAVTKRRVHSIAFRVSCCSLGPTHLYDVILLLPFLFLRTSRIKWRKNKNCCEKRMALATIRRMGASSPE